ncbi:MAG: hypothetical protein HKN46_06750 [Acidimicrobiia bacterium]|nr:hypothetical protein [Acidimicrobiia bacterium]
MSETRIPFRRMAMEVLKVPMVWTEALRAMASLRRAPLSPVPDGEYLAWRMHTAYGDDAIRPEDVVPYLRWRRRMRRTA